MAAEVKARRGSDDSVLRAPYELLSFLEFDMWKDALEEETDSQYAVKAKNHTDTMSTTYFKCNRSGYYKSEGKGVRHLKSQGTRKISASCPAAITLYENGETFEAFHVSTHFGHATQLCHLNLRAQVKKQLAAKLALRIPKREILNQVHENLTGTMKRQHLVTMHDLHNCEKLVRTDYQPNDVISVETWVREEMQNENCSILLYKPQFDENVVGVNGVQSTASPDMHGIPDDCLLSAPSEFPVSLEAMPELDKKDFFLAIMTNSQAEMMKQCGTDVIAVDSTHGTNAYDFQLTTLLVLDNYRQGFSVAYLISSRIDQPTIKCFFELVKLKTGCITCNVLISDDYPAYGNAWSEVMGAPRHRLLCCWHVHRNWHKNLKKIPTVAKQKETLEQLNAILKETDIDAFHKLLSGKLPATLSFERYHNFF